jgi:uncharacterized Tic20 family protein
MFDARKSGMELSSDERTWGLFAHLAGLAGNIVPLGSIVAPLVIWKMKEGESEFVADQAKESLNFQITMLIALLICIPLCFVFVGFFLIAALVVFDLVCIVLGMLRANEGIWYRYPVSIRFAK